MVWCLLISPKDVVSMKVPFPSINEGLALKAHMYICCDKSRYDKLIKVQTFKPLLLSKVNTYIDSNDYIGQHPFKHQSLIDLDKCFNIDLGTIPLSLKVKNNNGVISNDLHINIMNSTNNLVTCQSVLVETMLLKTINPLM